MALSFLNFMNNLSHHKSGPIEFFERKGHSELEVVLLHGIGSNALSFESLIKELPDSWRLIAWNAPGYGNSEPLKLDWPIAEDYALALKNFFNRLKLKSPLLVGHSLGALIATSFAANYPENVSKLLLASPALGYGQAVNETLDSKAQERIDELELLGVEKFAKRRASRLVANPDEYPMIVSKVIKEMMRINIPGYIQAVKMLASGELLKDALKLNCPTDVVVGAEDIITTPESSLKAYETINSVVLSNFTELQGAGHAIYQQSPKNFAKSLKKLAKSNFLVTSTG